MTNTYKPQLKQLINILRSLFPCNLKELYIFSFFILIYSSYSFVLAMNTFIIDDPEIHYDIFFGFDNTHIFHHGYLYIAGHPLLQILSMPFLYIGDILILICGLKGKTIFFTSICIILTSLSTVYIFRYLKEIIKLKKYPLYLLSIFFGFFMTNLIQCFTTESFTLSLTFITFTIFFYSKSILNNNKVYFPSNFALSFLLGGITISNFAMGITPILFTNEEFKKKIYRILLLCVLFGLLLLLLDFLYDGIFENIIFNLKTYTKPQNYYSYSRYHFLGAPMLSSDIFWNEDSIKYIGIGTTHFIVKQKSWQFVFIGIIFSFCSLGIIKNYKNKLVQLIVLAILPVFLLHQVGRYGLVDGFIYGAHWIYAIPLLIGWLFSSLNKYLQKVIIIIMSILCVIMIINNISILIKFISITLNHYPSTI